MALIGEKINFLISRGSPLYRLKRVKITEARQVFGIDYYKLRRWVRGTSQPIETELDVLVRSINHSFGLKLDKKIFDDSVDQVTFSQAVAAQIKADPVAAVPIHGKFFFSDFYQPSDRAEELFMRIRGFYLVYRAELSTFSKGVASQGTLLVSHIERDKHGCCIVCYLHLPQFGGQGYFPYVGCVGELARTYYWIFNERKSRNPDYIFLITDAGRFDFDTFDRFSGLYCTMNQDHPPIPVSRPVLIKRVDNSTHRDAMQRRMIKECRLFTHWSEVPSDVADVISLV